MSFQLCHILQEIMSVLKKFSDRGIVSLQQKPSIPAGNKGVLLQERMMTIQDDFVKDGISIQDQRILYIASPAWN